MMRFRSLLLLALSAVAAHASVTVTVSPTGSATPTGAYVRVDLQNCANPTVVNSGTTIPLSRQFRLNGASTVSITVEDNVTQIACNGNQLSYYTFTYVIAGGTETALKTVELPPGVFNLANLAPLSQPPWNPGVVQGPPGPAGPPGCTVGGTCSATFTPQQLGGVLYVNAFPGSTLAQKWNAANTQAVANGGGTIDARYYTGTQIVESELSCGSGSSESAGHGVACILPASAEWRASIHDGSSCLIKVWGGGMVRSDGAAGGALRMTLNTYDVTTDMDSLLCNASASDGGYYRIQDVLASDSNGGMLRNAAIHITSGYDGSIFHNLTAATRQGNDSFFVEGSCCHTLFSNITADSRTQIGGVTLGAATALRVGQIYYLENVPLTAGSCTITATNANFTPAFIGQAVDFESGTGSLGGSTTVTGWNPAHLPIQTSGGDVNFPARNTVTISPCVATTGVATLKFRKQTGTLLRRVDFEGFTANGALPGNYAMTVNGLEGGTFINGYMEAANERLTDDFAFVSPGTNNVNFMGMHCDDNSSNTTKYCFKNYAATAVFQAIRTSAGVDDRATNTIQPPDVGIVPYSMVSYYSTSRGIDYTTNKKFTINVPDVGNFGLGCNFLGCGAHFKSDDIVSWSSTANGQNGAIDTLMYRSGPHALNFGTNNHATSRDLDVSFGTGQLNVSTYAALLATKGACTNTTEGTMAAVNDSSTTTYGATITGGGTGRVKAYCNGTNYVVD